MKLKNLSRIHKERPQPTNRKNGFLEKKKDYQIRSKNYHRKKDHLTALRRKADTKNPDEFYFSMINSKITNGRHNTFSNNKTRENIIKMTKEDIAYLNYLNTYLNKKIEKLKNNIHFINSSKKSKHIIFSDNNSNNKEENITKIKTSDDIIEETNNEGRNITKNKKKYEYVQIELYEKKQKEIYERLRELRRKINLMGKGKKNKNN